MAESKTQPTGEDTRGLRIGEMAGKAGVSTRTLRYYEQLGLLKPSDRNPGGNRRYTDDELARLLRIRELQSLMGFNLRDIQIILAAEDRLQALRAEFQADMPLEHRRAIVREGIAVVEELTAQVAEKLRRVESFHSSLVEKTERYRKLLADLGED